MALYAQNTTVPVHKSRAEIEALLVKHKASQYLTAHDTERGQAVVQFKIQNRIVRFIVKLPDRATIARRLSRASAVDKVIDQNTRQRWRALLLVIKAKLECVENGIATFEEEFLAHIVLPNDQTVGEVIMPRVAAAYEQRGPIMLTEHISEQQ
jgi:hypothetical protein